MPRVCSIKKLPSHYNYTFTDENIQYWLLNKWNNGFLRCLVKRGLRKLIDLEDNRYLVYFLQICI